MSFLGLYRDPIIAANTACSDWRIADLTSAERPVSLFLVVPPSDISRTCPLVRLILNQIARRLTETLPESSGTSTPRLLLMLDEFPALGRLDFFETSLAFMAGYGVRAFLVAQSLHQIDRAYGANHAILTPPLGEREQQPARALGKERFQVFVAQIGRRLVSDRRVVSDARGPWGEAGTGGFRASDCACDRAWLVRQGTTRTGRARVERVRSTRT